MAQPQAIEIVVYHNAVPEFVYEPLDRLYRHLRSSFIFQSVYGYLSKDTHTCVLRQGSDVTAVLLFRCERSRVRVLNEQCAFEPYIINAFSKHIFDQFSYIHVVSFPAIESMAAGLNYPFQQAKTTQDIVINLPESKEIYLAKLGKSTRANIKYYSNKFRRHFPSMSWLTCSGGEADENHIRAIITLNHARMAGKNKSSYIDEVETERVMRLVRQCGLITVILVDGKVCAGTINYRVADNYFLQVLSHDPAYNDYGLGTLCCYLTICECIERKGCEYHFLWGRYEYKYRLLGEQRDLSHLLVYRSRFYMLYNSATVMRHAYLNSKYEIKNWVEHRANRMDNSSVFGQLAYQCLNKLRKAKRFSDGIRMRKNSSQKGAGL